MLRTFSYWLLRYKRTWRGTIVISVANPLLFLLGIGAGLGHLVDQHRPAPIGGLSYLAFFAPGMLAAAAMQTGYFESAGGAARAVLPDGPYRAATPTPVGPSQIMGGHLLYVTFRVATSSLAFVLAMVAFGVTGGWAAPATLVAATLTGVAFAAPASAWAVSLRRNQHVAVVFRFVILPMYMFAGTFFAVAQMPGWLRPAVYALPLYHGATLCRSLATGTATWAGVLLHGGILVTLVVAGILAGRITYRRRLHA